MIVPCGLTASLAEEEKNVLLDKCRELEEKLKAAEVRTKGDYRDNYSPGWKFNHWELKVSYCSRKCSYYVYMGATSLVESRLFTIIKQCDLISGMY